MKLIHLILVLAGISTATADIIYRDDFQQFPKGTALTETNYIPAIGAEASISTSGEVGPITASEIQNSIRALFQPGKVPYIANYLGVPLTGVQTNQVLSLSFLLQIDSRKATNSFGGFLISLPNANLQSNPLIWLNDGGQVYVLTNNASTPVGGITIGSWSDLAGKITTNVLVLNYPAGKFSYSLNSRILTNMPLPGIFTNVFDRIRLDIQESFTNSPNASLGNKFALDDIQLTNAGTNLNIATYIAAAKGVYFNQNISSGLSLAPTGFVFIAQVHATDTNSIRSVLDQTPTGSILTVPQTPTGSTVFLYEQAFANFGSLNTAYPSGIYNLTIATRDQGILTAGLQLPVQNYPSAPRIANLNAARMIDSTNDFTLTWNQMSGGTSNDFISVEIVDPAGNIVFNTPGFGETNQLDGTATSALIPAGTFSPSMVYTGTVLFFRASVRDTNSIPDVTGVTGYFESTQFPLGTITTGECSYVVSPTEFTFTPDATNGIIQVTSGYACPWYATNETDYITIYDGTSGISTGTVAFFITKNTTAYDRTTTITVAGQPVTISQSSPGCSHTISATNANFTAAGDTNSFSVTSNGTNCEWTAASNNSFIIITTTNVGIGDGIVEYSVDTNTTVYPRTGTITVGTNTFTITQDARDAFTDLLVTKDNTPSTVYVGSNLIYTLIVSNLGPDDARNIVLTDLLPDAAKYLFASATQGLVYRSGTTNTTVTAELGTIIAGSNATVIVTCTPTASGDLTNSVSITSIATDIDTNNNTATAVATAIAPPVADLEVKSIANPKPVFYGSNLAFTVTVSNAGPASAPGIVLTNSLPAGVTNVTAATQQGSCTQVEGQVICTLDELPVSSNAVVTITLQPVSQGSICCTSTVTGALSDPVPGNNSIISCAGVVAHDLAVVGIKAPKTVQLTTAKPLSTQLIRVTIQNRSPQNEMITAATVSNLCTLVLTSLHTNSLCVVPLATLHSGPPQKTLPATLKPKQKFTLVFDVRFDCATDPAKATPQEPWHDDFSYTATVHHEALDNQPDVDPYDDVCPHNPLPYPGQLDPFPDGKLRDLGAGGKIFDGTYGAPVTTDVIESQ